jgi:hypothetical protein
VNWRRTITYYFTAFVGGAIAWGGVFYLYNRFVRDAGASEPGDPYFLIISIVPILLNVVPQMVAAVILRVLARRMAWSASWQWVLAGTVISLAVVFAAAQFALSLENTRFSIELQRWKTMIMFLFLGPMIVTTRPLWLPAIAAAMVSFLLWAVQHAGRNAAPKTQPSS